MWCGCRGWDSMRVAEVCFTSRRFSAQQGRHAIATTRRSECGYFLATGFVLSCFGFMLFLSFFCELLPLPMTALPWGFRVRSAACEPFHPFNRHIVCLRSVPRPKLSLQCYRCASVKEAA